jgi:hypothetical protein
VTFAVAGGEDQDVFQDSLGSGGGSAIVGRFWETPILLGV